MPTLLDSYIENRHRVQPNHANTVGTAHGGDVMKWLDEVSAMSAMRFAGETCVTARMDPIEFHRPIGVGDIAVIESYVYDTGNTSVRVRLTADRENPRTGERERTTTSHAVFVAVDENMKPTKVPDLMVETERGENLRAAALESREP
ncbi:acyl-CoA thioester hydrolase [Salinarchaeum sp. Harcht-Bsk1]|uniref:acyl-CoA thioesterase n=1 Tax=Salinarchaeum sp. Harcht-Bsk1 TaxID=1333523 RepID=UPI0003424239|nr:acyl-CoA thioesterase [Salinarchaeum sp. Harcht-Bsk1]AGN01135.1 acyl-CoA thioester hydrolase [Salinarchaeum sp. Harcht-Bsk1]